MQAHDPNDKAGPQGVGQQHYVTGAAALPYSVLFGNEDSATAPAQSVVITDPLSSDLDLTTVTLGPITFANQVVTPPPVPLAGGPFTTLVDLRPTTNLLVQITASLDTTAGVLTVIFQSLDPATNQPPTDPLTGFLPPGAEGSVLITASPKPGLSTGTVISNSAHVTFDTNPAIDTPTWSNTIDSSTPTSQVASLPAAENSPDFQVQWSGTDSFSGISDFTIYVSVNGGPFTPWIQTSDTSATYAGQPGNTYSFYSLAMSNAGNVENAKTFADASTTVLRPTALSYGGPTSGHYGDTVALAATLTDTSVSPASGISGVPVTLNLGTQSCTGTTDTAGTATCSVRLSQAPGSVNVSASFAGNSVYLPSSTTPTPFTIGTAVTTTSLSSSPGPSVYGQPVTFTAAVTPADGGGTAAFYADGSATPVSGCGAVPLAQAAGGTWTAICITSVLPVGSHAITVSYSGDTNYASSSGSLAGGQTVNPAPTTTSLASSADPSVYGQQVTFTAAITPADGGGSAVFYADGSASPVSGCGTVPLTQAAGGTWTAICTTSALPVGSHSITVSYSGDTDYAGSSGSLAGGQTVNPAPTTTSLASSADPSSYSSAVTFTATVTPSDGGGTVAFDADGSVTAIAGCGSVPLTQVTGSTWIAGCTTSALPAGSHPVSASYSGDSSYLSSSGNLAGGQQVNPAPLTITASGGSMTYGATPPVITPAYSGFVGGDGPASLSTPPACSTTATLASPVGTYPSSCSGAADPNYAISYISGQVTVSQAGTTLAYTGPQSASSGASLTPAAALASPASACQAGQPVSFTLNVNPATGAAGPYSLGSATTSGSGAAAGASVSTAGWLAGAYTITASYAGTANCGAATATAPLAVTTPGLAAAGAGRYTIPGAGPVKFGFVVAQIPHTTIYLGGISLVQDGAWRLAGIVSSYVKTASNQGTVTGTGSLFWWNPALNNHTGGWQLARTGVAFTATFSATTKTSPGTFGIKINYTPAPPQPATLPNSSPLTLQTGIIAMA